MHSRPRIPGEGFRSGPVGLGVSAGRISPFSRNHPGRGGFSRGPLKPHQFPRKLDILREAGRLAVEYLVRKGDLPPTLLHGGWTNGNPQEFKAQGREIPSPAPLDSRPPAIAQLGSSVSDVGYGRRRFNDEYDRTRSRKNLRGRRRTGFYDRGYGSDWGRERGRNEQWIERSRGYSDSVEDDDDDYAPGYRRDRRGGYDEVGSSVSRVAGDEPPSKSEVVGESGSELDDAGSKASSSSTRKDVPAEAAEDLNKGMDDGKALNSETGEVKSDENGELEKKTISEEDLAQKPPAVEDDSEKKHGNDLLKLCSFARVPTKPRSSLANKLVIDQAPSSEARNKAEDVCGGVSEMVVEDQVKSTSSDSLVNQTESPKCEVPASSDVPVIPSMEVAADTQHESHQSPQYLESTTMIVDAGNNDRFAQPVGEEESKIQRNSSPFREAQVNELSQLHDLKASQSGLFDGVPSQDEEMIEAVDQTKLVGSTLVPKLEAESNVKMEEETQNQSTSFKICDLNLMQTPEVTEIPDDPVLEHHHTFAPLETEKQLPVDFGLTKSNNINDNHSYSRFSDDEKVVPVIDLENDSPVEVNTCDSSQTKTDMIYPTLENVLDHAAHTDILPATHVLSTAHSDVLPAIQDGYGLGMTDYLGADISVQAELNNLHAGMSLHGAEGFPGVDDSIYGSLGDIGFMEVWDQPTQDYEKFF